MVWSFAETLPALKSPLRYDCTPESEMRRGAALLSTKSATCVSVDEMVLPVLLYCTITVIPGTEPLKLFTKLSMPLCSDAAVAPL